MIIAMLGRQPEIGLAELESLFGSDKVSKLGVDLAQIDNNSQNIPYSRFGSVLKFAEVITKTPSPKLEQLQKLVVDYITKNSPPTDGVKVKLGISSYGIKMSASSLNILGLTIKKNLKHKGYSVRVVPNKEPNLSSAQVIHNKLTGANGFEIVLVNHGGSVIVGQTVYEQDIEAYTKRDQVRPMRDAKVGMLPPKLAQTIINLAVGQSATTPETTILDPFCGTGVVLQEALLMGYTTYGTDLEPRMIEYSQKNIAWLKERRNITNNLRLEIGDATDYQWQPPFDFIAGETYLGRPLFQIPSKDDLAELVQSVNTLHKRTLANLHKQLKVGDRLCLAMPAWQTKNGFVSLPVLDQLSKIGYNQLEFKNVNTHNLIYARSNQIVGRQLVVLQKV